jgi:hypothetical protein
MEVPVQEILERLRGAERLADRFRLMTTRSGVAVRFNDGVAGQCP